jgi:hypothetical protein
MKMMFDFGLFLQTRWDVFRYLSHGISPQIIIAIKPNIRKGGDSEQFGHMFRNTSDTIHGK